METLLPGGDGLGPPHPYGWLAGFGGGASCFETSMVSLETRGSQRLTGQMRALEPQWPGERMRIPERAA